MSSKKSSAVLVAMARLNEFICTVHITKPLYAENGFASPRYLENLAVGVPALVPQEFKFNEILGKQWCVGSADDVFSCITKIKNMSFQERKELLEYQKESLLSHYNFNVSNVVEFLESLI